jgi:hypothetical protein
MHKWKSLTTIKKKINGRERQELIEQHLKPNRYTHTCISYSRPFTAFARMDSNLPIWLKKHTVKFTFMLHNFCPPSVHPSYESFDKPINIYSIIFFKQFMRLFLPTNWKKQKVFANITMGKLKKYTILIVSYELWIFVTIFSRSKLAVFKG